MEDSLDPDTRDLDFEPIPELFPNFRAAIDPDFRIPSYPPSYAFDSLLAPLRIDNGLGIGSDMGFLGLQGRVETGSYEVPEFDEFLGLRNEGLRVTGFDSDSDYDEAVPGFGIMNLVDSDSDYEDGVPGFGIMNLVDSESDYEEGVPGFGAMNLVDSDYEDGVPGFGTMNLVDSDYEDGVPGLGVMNLVDSSSEDGDGMVPVDESDVRLRWGGFGSEDLRAPNDEDWEEVDERVDSEREELGALGVIEELSESESSEISAEEEDDDDPTLEAIRNLEWEILLERDSILEPDADFDSYFDVHEDDHISDAYTTNQETLFGQFEGTESAAKGSPPAAKTVVKNLPLVELRKEGLGESNVVCAVCKDGILADEKVRKLPCCHYYHSDCILPWLNIRNTCPICRYELATDDPGYERRKAQRAVRGLGGEEQVRFNFELFA